MSKWADYSFARPTPAQLKQYGVVGVMRYIAPDTQNTHGKLLTAEERDTLLTAGLDVALNFEWYEGRCNEGAMAGVQDAVTAVASATHLQYPLGKTIYFSHDTGVYDWQKIEAYFRAVKDGLAGKYLVGAYGSYELITRLHNLGLIDKGWQTLAWSFGQRDPWAVIYQTGTQLLDGQVDVDDVTSTDIGSWRDGPPAPAPDWFGMATEAELTKVVGEQLAFYLPRTVGLLRNGQGNKAFNPENSGPLVDNHGIDGILKDLEVRVADLQAKVAAQQPAGAVDYPTLAEAIVTNLLGRLK